MVQTDWIHVEDNGCCEEYDRCIRRSDARILVEIMHAKNDSPSNTFGVFRNGAGYGEYETRQAAIEAASRLVPECVMRP